MIAIILSDKSQKRIESGRGYSSISSYRYAALKVRGCVPRGPDAAGCSPGGQAGRVFSIIRAAYSSWVFFLEDASP